MVGGLGDLPRPGQHPLLLVGVQADPSHPVDHRGHRGHAAAGADDGLAPGERLGVRGRGQSELGEDRRLHRDDGPATGQRVGDLVGDDGGGSRGQSGHEHAPFAGQSIELVTGSVGLPAPGVMSTVAAVALPVRIASPTGAP